MAYYYIYCILLHICILGKNRPPQALFVIFSSLIWWVPWGKENLGEMNFHFVEDGSKTKMKKNALEWMKKPAKAS